MNQLYKILISIPTKNRPEYINYYLQSVLPKMNLDCAIYIYDSSENNLTRNVILKYASYKNLYYKKLDCKTEINSKTYKCLQCEIKSEYLWLCSDKIVIDPLIINHISRAVSKHSYSIIVVSNRDKKNLKNKVYYDKKLLFNDCAWDMTLYGSTILNRKNVNLKEEKYYLNNYPNNIFSLPFYFDNDMEIEKFLFMSINYYLPNLHDLSSSWSNEVFFTFIHEWLRIINLLPNEYGDYKRKVIKEHGILSGLFTYKSFVRHRSNNNLNLKLYKEYSTEFHKVTNVNKYYILGLCFIPKNLIKSLLKIWDLINRGKINEDN